MATRPADGDEDVIVRSEALAVRQDIETRVRAFIARRLYDVGAFYPVVGQLDPALREAMRHWDDAVTLAQAQ